jgi:hypothetical protein
MAARSGRRTAGAALGILVIGLVSPQPLLAADAGYRAAAAEQLTADLNGAPIALAGVGHWFCEDFAYPAIHCFTSSRALERSVSASLSSASATALTYVVVYEYTSYQGAYMYMSDDYQALSVIGWNDRISSISVRNSMSGKFWTDWFYTGTGYYFCCNSQVSYLGSLDNTFSAVFHY